MLQTDLNSSINFWIVMYDLISDPLIAGFSRVEDIPGVT